MKVLVAVKTNLIITRYAVRFDSDSLLHSKDSIARLRV